MLDALGTLRNQASLARPNDPLPEPEAMLCVHAARTLLHYLEARLKSAPTSAA